MIARKKLWKIIFYTLSLYILICIVGMQLYNGEKAADYATSHTLNRSHTLCAGFVMRALWSGHCYIGLYSAWSYKYILPLYGFKVVDTTNYKKGDIIVFPAVSKHIWGHIAIYNGSQWVSDFKQKSKVVAPAYNTVKPTAFRYKRNIQTNNSQ